MISHRIDFKFVNINNINSRDIETIKCINWIIDLKIFLILNEKIVYGSIHFFKASATSPATEIMLTSERRVSVAITSSTSAANILSSASSTSTG
jgi:hypothetical protein